MTNQEAFDTVRKHLLCQGAKSMDAIGWNCMYRGAGGRKCAVGALIPDEDYAPRIEGIRISKICVPGLDGVSMQLLSRLQFVHDDMDPENWESALVSVARDFGLAAG